MTMLVWAPLLVRSGWAATRLVADAWVTTCTSSLYGAKGRGAR